VLGPAEGTGRLGQDDRKGLPRLRHDEQPDAGGNGAGGIDRREADAGVVPEVEILEAVTRERESDRFGGPRTPRSRYTTRPTLVLSPMPVPLDPATPELRVEFYRLYRDFFDRAERKRRWSVADDVPWGDANKALNPAVADVVEAFCTVEMYLPDYIAKALPMIRVNRG